MIRCFRSFALILTGLVCLLGSGHAAAMYDPGMGRFMQRDPAGYPDGMNSYGAYHVQRGGVDPSGLWKIDRNNTEFYASAEAEAGDTIRTLADTVGLNVEEFIKWMSVRNRNNDISLVNGEEYSFGAMEDMDVDEEICPGETVGVPNMVVISLGDSVDWDAVRGVGGSWVFVDMDRLAKEVQARRRAQGFFAWIDEGTSNREIVDLLDNKTRWKQLHQFYFFGHADGVSGIINTAGGAGVPPARYTHYGINSLVLAGCGSIIPSGARLDYIDSSGVPGHIAGGVPGNTAWRLNVSRNGKLWGYELCKVRFWNLKDDIISYPGLTPRPGINDRLEPSSIGTP